MLSEKKNRKSISKIWLFLKIPKSIHNSTYCQRLDSKLYFSEIFDHFPQRIQLFLAREKKSKRKTTENMENIHEYLCQSCVCASSASNTLGRCENVFIAAAATAFSAFPAFPSLRCLLCLHARFVGAVGGWAVGVLSGWRCYSLGVVLCERSRTRLIRHVRVLYELWPRRGSGHQNGEILNIYSGKRVCYSGVYIYISKAERCQHWHINFAHQRYN